MELTHRTVDVALVPACGNEGNFQIVSSLAALPRIGRAMSAALVLQPVALAGICTTDA